MGMTTEQIEAVVDVLRGHAEHFTAMAREARTDYLHASSPYETGKLEGIAYGLETAAAALEAGWLRINNDEPSRENEPPPDSWVQDSAWVFGDASLKAQTAEISRQAVLDSVRAEAWDEGCAAAEQYYKRTVIGVPGLKPIAAPMNPHLNGGE